MKKIYLLLIIAICSFKSFSQVSVTATIGTTGPSSYTTLKAAFDAINAGTHKGIIAISINGNTTEIATAVVNASGTATSSYTSLSIKPAGGARSITGSNVTGPLIDLNGADNVNIDGLNSGGNSLTISNPDAGSSYAIRYINDAIANTIQNTSILSSGTGTTLGTVYFSTALATGNDNNTIFNCSISDAGGNSPVNAIVSDGTAVAGQENSGNTIAGNNISNFFNPSVTTAGISLLGGNTDWTIFNNKFFQTSSRTFTTGNIHKAIQVTSGNNYSISGNIIGYASTEGAGVYTIGGTIATRFIGIDLAVGTATASSVQNNTITNFLLTTSSGAGTLNGVWCAINITGGNVNVGTVLGNTIGATSGTGAITVTPSTGGAAVVPINSSGTGVVNISNNTIGSISLLPSGVLSGNMPGIQVTGTSGTITVNNNTIGNSTPENMRIGVLNTTTGNGIIRGVFNTNSGTLAITSNTIRNLVHNSNNALALFRVIECQQGAPLISGNTISNVFANGTAASALTPEGAGILITSPTQGLIVDQNTISNIGAINSSTSTVIQGIYLGGTTGVNGITVTRNKIYGLSNAGTSASTTVPAAIAGIYCRDANVANPVTFANNMISLGNGQLNNLAIIGIWNAAVAAQNFTEKIYYNTINIEGTVGTGAQPSFGYYRGDFSATPAPAPVVDIRNNILNNSRSGGTGKHYAIANGYGATSTSAAGWPANASDYNVLNATAATIGYWTTDQNFGGWKIASAGDANSLSGVAVSFVNSATDLHLVTSANTAIDGKAIPIAGFTTDIDNESRNATTPDPGADEFTPGAMAISVEYFKGKKAVNTNVLNWKAGCTSTSVTFEVERGNDTRRFISIGSFTATKARCSQPFDYTDNNILAGTNYYRLKMTEIDGEVSYSSIIAILNKEKGFEVISVTPTLIQNGYAKLNMTAAQKTQFEVVITDMLGKVMSKQTAVSDAGSSTLDIDVKNLARGAYQLSVFTNDTKTTTLRFVKL